MTTQATPIRLRPPGNRVDQRAIPWWRWQLVLTAATLAVLLVVPGIFIPPARFWLVLAAIVVVVIAVPLAVLLPLWWYRVHRWEVTGTAVYTRTGYFFQESRIAPMSRIQTVDTERGPLEQRFGLATLIITTASSAGAVTVKGLDGEVAAELAHRLADITKLIPQDAT
ncbi:PH domain-containing protein [Kibdelosporangium persicum]|uniref:Membrane-flanked domain-containing protein n=1 Tax=Kibdelosporangium persicum TaxID=2698649 RepID=A0ABX2F9M0_9PSEU|nr:PH domain-containing protein [Kibdelosporangium persicum]NRN67972.1 Membrane-flanked domain-containing protein [Kibdelosporangium persicum]